MKKRKKRRVTNKIEYPLRSSIKKRVNHTVGIITHVHSLTFTIFFIIEKILESYVYPLIPDGLSKQILITVIAAGLYYVLFLVVKVSTDKVIDRFKKQFDICGVWHHVHIPHLHMKGEIDYSRERLRCGMTIIDRDLYDFSLEAVNHNYWVQDDAVINDTDSATRWNSIISEISETSESPYDFIEIYRAETNENARLDITTCPCCGITHNPPLTIHEADRSRYGIHKLKIDLESYNPKLRCYTRIYADYCDCGTSIKTGELWLYKSERDRDNRIKKYFSHKITDDKK